MVEAEIERWHPKSDEEAQNAMVHVGESNEYGVALHPDALLYLVTIGGARALDLEDRIGNFDVGREADRVVIDSANWRPLANSLE